MQQFVAKSPLFEANTRALSRQAAAALTATPSQECADVLLGTEQASLLKGTLPPVTVFGSEFASVTKQNSTFSKPSAIAAVSALTLTAAALLSPAIAEPGSTGSSSDSTISIELNKMESTDKGCSTVLVVNNPTDTAYSKFQLDLVMFEGGVVGSRIALDLAPVREQKRSVKQFELSGSSCDKISEYLINDVIECKTKSGDVDGCLKHISVSSLTKAKLTK